MTSDGPGGFGRRAQRRVRGATSTPTPELTSSGGPASTRQAAGGALAEARQLASEGRQAEAEQRFREAIAFDPAWGVASVEYARHLIAASNSAGAEEVLAAAIALNGALPDGVELFSEVLRKRDRPIHHLRWSLARLVADLPLHPEAHRGALDYVVAHQLHDAEDTLMQSPDAVSRAVVALDRLYRHALNPDPIAVGAATRELSRKEADRALAIVLLGRGQTAHAIELLRAMDPTAVPLNSLRRAIRRAIAGDRIKQARSYLTVQLQLRPDDGWAKRALASVGEQEFSNYRLGKSGFPLPKRAAAPAYVADPRKVFYLLHNSLPYNSAGYATRTHGLLSGLNRAGWDVDGVTRLGYPYDMPGNAELPDVPARDEVDGVDYLRLLAGREIEKKNPLYFYVERYRTALQELAKRERPAIIHAASNHWNGLTAVAAANELGVPSIYEVRGLWEVTRGSRNPEWTKSNMFHYIARMEADAARGATKVFTITNALREEMIARGVDGDKITVLPNGVDSSRFTPIGRDEALAHQLGVHDKTVIGYIGSILDYEGLELLIDAAAELAAVRSDFHVLFVGDGAELERFQDRVRNDGLASVVTFTGRVPHEQVERYYSLVDIAPFPRLPLPVCEMVSPLKPFEAMAMGKAVIASDVAALAEFVTPGVNGLLHTKGDARSLQAELARLLDDPDLRRRTGAQAREWVVANRDWTQISRTVAEAYEELLRGA